MRRFIPDPIKRLYETRGSLTIFALVVATALTQPFSLGWREFEIISFFGLLALVGDFWLDARRKDIAHMLAIDSANADRDVRVAELEDALSAERETIVLLREQLSDTESVVERVAELEVEKIGLEIERDELLVRLQTPRASLQEILISVDHQIAFIDLIAKHRAMREEVGSQWPVTELKLRPDGVVQATAHVEGHAERTQAEGVTLVDSVSGAIHTNGLVDTASGHVMTAVFGEMPDWVMNQLYENSVFSPHGMALKLLGLTFSPYVSMEDDQLRELRDSLRAVARRIDAVLNPAEIAMVEVEEGTS